MERRTRNWASVIYPDSQETPDNWIEIIKEQIVPCFISPIHDKDINENGEIKKSHFHALLCFEGVKTREQAKEIFSLVGGVGAEPIKCVRAYARYLCHLDNPEKAQYSINDVICCCGADYYSLIQSSSDKYSAIGEIIDFCETEDIVSYAELIIYARENNFEWFKVLCDSGTLPIVQFLKSRYWEIDSHLKRSCVWKRGVVNEKRNSIGKEDCIDT